MAQMIVDRSPNHLSKSDLAWHCGSGRMVGQRTVRSGEYSKGKSRNAGQPGPRIPHFLGARNYHERSTKESTWIPLAKADDACSGLSDDLTITFETEKPASGAWGFNDIVGEQRIALLRVVASLDRKRLGDEFSSSIGAFFLPCSSIPIRSRWRERCGGRRRFECVACCRPLTLETDP
jgi:hypothetical protein